MSIKAIFFCTGYMRSEEEWRTRYLSWLNYHRQLSFADTRFLIIDDASPYTPESEQIRCVNSNQDLTKVNDSSFILRFDERLGRNAPISYHGWWRSFLHSVSVARALDAQKIIHVESDAFLLSDKITNYIKNLDRGWTAFWAPRYNMPETAIQVICADQFNAIERFKQQKLEEFDGLMAERILPFTNVQKDFVGDRYSEVNILKRTPLRLLRFHKMQLFQGPTFSGQIPLNADFVTQVIANQRLKLAEFVKP